MHLRQKGNFYWHYAAEIVANDLSILGEEPTLKQAPPHSIIPFYKKLSWLRCFNYKGRWHCLNIDFMLVYREVVSQEQVYDRENKCATQISLEQLFYLERKTA